MILKDLLKGCDVVLYGEGHISISAIVQDSRHVTPGSLFVAIKGFQQDGHDYCDIALEKGAVAIVVETLPERFEQIQATGVAVVHADNTREILAKMARTFYEKPDEAIKLIGITGTNGKTSLTYIIEALIQSEYSGCGVIGTIAIRYGDFYEEATGTTPEAVPLMKHFKQMKEKNIDFAVMEVSSHALSLSRVSGLSFELGIFTNLTQDHLDFHETMEAYFNAKKRLFMQVSGKSVINIDDPYGANLYHELKSSSRSVVSYGFSPEADYVISGFSMDYTGSRFTLTGSFGVQEFKLSVPGRFNAYNFTAAVIAGLHLEIPLERIVEILPQVTIPGRLQQVDNPLNIPIYVDYAHTPDALLKAIKAVSEFTEKRVICVFGCGGDRDRGKRPMMGEIAETEADLVIVTSDNPRTEEPSAIIQDILKGMKHPDRALINVDRYEAISEAVRHYQKGDCILIAGKGHENYQIIGSEKVHFDDKETAQTIVRGIYDQK